MPAIVPIVEGDGDVEAVPVLVRTLLAQQQAWGWTVARPKKAGGLNNLRSRLADFLRYADGERDCGGILIMSCSSGDYGAAVPSSHIRSGPRAVKPSASIAARSSPCS